MAIGRIDELAEALRYGARLVTRQVATKRLHQLTTGSARVQVTDRWERKRETEE